MKETKLNVKEVEKIQIDHGLIYLDYGETSQRLLSPTRGGGEFVATVTVRDIEFDGRNGKVAGMQVIEENAATLKTTLLGMTQENLRLAIPGAKVDESTEGVIKNPKMGVISADKYWKNVTMFAHTLDGAYKKITILNPMSEGEMTVTTQHKAEGELGITFNAHYPMADLDGDLWSVEDASDIVDTPAQSAGTEGQETEDQS